MKGTVLLLCAAFSVLLSRAAASQQRVTTAGDLTGRACAASCLGVVGLEILPNFLWSLYTEET